MAEPNPQQLLANTLSVVAVLLMSSGILVNTLPLESRRPADSERATISHAGRQDVEARLWQDPFTVMQSAKGKVTGGTRCDAAIADTDHHPATLSRLLARRARNGSPSRCSPCSSPADPTSRTAKLAGARVTRSRPRCSAAAGIHRTETSSATSGRSRAACRTRGCAGRRRSCPGSGFPARRTGRAPRGCSSSGWRTRSSPAIRCAA